MTDRTLKSRVKSFFRKDSAAGIMLIIATIAALIIANSPLGNAYHALLENRIVFGISGMIIDETFHHWINDGLMAIFFLLVGLEIKRELKYGELSTVQSALLPAVAALGGAIVPALIYYFFTGGTAFIEGWAIAIATDIAFVIGIMALLGSKMPVWAKVFVTAVAVVDDLIAVLAIAFFYTADIDMPALGIAGICLALLLFFNFRKVNRLSPYMIIGFVMWWAVLKSGVHATVAGVVLGFVIPASRQWSVEKLKDYAREGFELFKQATDKNLPVTREQALTHMDKTVEQAKSPLHRLEHKLHGVVYFVVMPLFALANAGIALDLQTLDDAFSSPLTWGIILGLFVGKQIGIFGSTWALTKMGFSGLPDSKETWKVVYGVALLGGVGFTMSLFIANLAFQEALFLEYSKVGILIGSLLSGILGYYFLSRRPEYEVNNQDELEFSAKHEN
jgi:NhaA family Na+:H+ antiporter